MKKMLFAAALAALVGGPAFGAPQKYEIDQDHTFPRFSYSHLGMSKQSASRFNKSTGTVVLDKEAGTGAVDITIDMNSVDTGSDEFDKHLKSSDFFDTAKYPTATFKSTGVKFEGDRLVSVDGDLTIKGITRPVTLTVTSFVNQPHPRLKKDAIGANATAVVKRSEFNAGAFAPAVSDEVTLDIALEAVLQ